jgi:SNF2 family DNA or RNA helicase
MYECVMGLRATSFYGCLLADEMGLGKTLQVIALIWTLIRQGPAGHPTLKRAVVICPSSLVQNWEKEVQKWLGSERLRPLVVHGGTTSKEAKQKCADFKSSKLCPLLITSYELLRKYQDAIASAKPGLLVCDEAHRLKNWFKSHVSQP